MIHHDPLKFSAGWPQLGDLEGTEGPVVVYRDSSGL